MPDEPAPADARRSRAAAEAVYQDLILEHYRRPRNRVLHDAPDRTAALRNPLCGDEVTVTVLLDGGRVREARASAVGCSIAAASASMMTELAPGCDADGLARLCDGLGRVLAGDAPADGGLGDLRAFAGLARVPARHRCALLAWEALRRALEGGDR